MKKPALQVAVKVLSRKHAENPDIVRRFFNEARAVNDIGHPNLVDIIECTRTDEHTYLVMELLEGLNLGDAVRRGETFDVARAVHIGAQVADALEAAHRRGIVHRDMKPDNIFLIEHRGDPDFVKVLDFGIAKLAHLSGFTTATGVLMGTPRYMSPEQTEGPRVDGRADTYALGVILYELLSGRPPFQGNSPMRIIKALWTDTPPRLQELRPDLPPWLDRVVMQAFAREKTDRFQTAGALREALLSEGAAGDVAPRPHAINPLESAHPAATIRAGADSDLAALVQNLRVGAKTASQRKGRGNRPSRPIKQEAPPKDTGDLALADTKRSELPEARAPTPSAKTAPDGGSGKWIAFAVALVIVLALLGFFAVRAWGGEEEAIWPRSAWPLPHTSSPSPERTG